MDSLSCLKNLKNLHPIRIPQKKNITKRKLIQNHLQISRHISPWTARRPFLCSPGPRSTSKRWSPNTLSTTWSKPPSQISKQCGTCLWNKKPCWLRWDIGVDGCFHGKNLAFFFGRKKPSQVIHWKKKRLPDTTPNIFDRPTAGQTTRIVVVPHGQTRHIGWQLLVAQLLFGPWASIWCDVMYAIHPNYKRPILPWKRWKTFNVKSFYHPCICFIHSSLSSPNSFRKRSIWQKHDTVVPNLIAGRGLLLEHQPQAAGRSFAGRVVWSNLIPLIPLALPISKVESWKLCIGKPKWETFMYTNNIKEHHIA